MVLSRPKPLTAVALVILLVGAFIPSITGQSADALCADPEDGGSVSGSSVEKGYDDLVVDLKNVRFTPSSGDVAAAERVGVHYLTPSTGRLAFDVDVDNIGPGSATHSAKVPVRIVLAQPNGQGIVKNVELDVPARGSNASAATAIDLTQTGRHTLQLHVNPGGAATFTEECKDTANPSCPDSNGAPSSCHFTYYHNNAISYGILAAARPDLVVSQITVDGPARATAKEHPDSEVTVRATIQNVGAVTAYNLGGLTPGALPFPISIAITGCTCSPVTATVKDLAPDASATVEATMKAHGLANDLEVEVTIDPASSDAARGVVIESNEKNNEATETFDVPTPDLIVSVTTDLDLSDGRIIVPKGHDLDFVVNVQNIGTAKAAKTNGDGFRIIGSRDSPANSVLLERLVLDAHSSVTYRITEEAQNLTGSHDFKIVVDDQGDVLEATEDNNEYVLGVTVAHFEAELKIKEASANPTVPPGVAGRVPFTLTNKGTVTDTYTLTAPAADQGRVSFVDGSGKAVRDVQLKKGASFNGEMYFEIPKDATKGDTFDTSLRVRSAGSGDTTERDIRFTIGDDDLPPTIALEDPKSGFLSGNDVVLRITDNVNVSSVETDISGSFVTVHPDDPGGSLYTINVTGRPSSFKLNVRATDQAGNEKTSGFDLVRDTTAPRITKVTIVPEKGIVPGMKVTAIIEARDENMDSVRVKITQPRPDGLYEESHTLVATNANFQLRDWTVPERPGHYVLRFTAIDEAGNEVSRETTLPVQGFDIRVPPQFSRPVVSPAAPNEGDLVRLTYRIENTSPIFSTGPFVVGLGVDRADVEGDVQFIGKQTIDLAPGEVRPISFVWSAAQGEHFFALVLDQTLQVAEEREDNNLNQQTTTVLFPDHALFAPSAVDVEQTTFGARLVDYWFVPVLFITTIVLFVIAVALGRRSPA